MTYDIQKVQFVKEKFFYVEVDLDYCDLTYGNSPCTASIGVTGDKKCFNTAKNCQDRDNYTKSPKTYRFCSDRSPLPVGLDAIPSLMAAPSFAAAQIDPKGGLGVRGSVGLQFKDHPHSDVNIDKYVTERTYIPYETGTYWGKLRARNPFYTNRPLRVYSGYLVNGEFDPVNFQCRTYVIEGISSNRGVATISGKDVLKLTDSNKAIYPPKSTGELLTDVDEVTTSIVLAPAGVGNDEYPASGFVRVGSEVMSFTRVGDTLTVVRGEYNTEPDSFSSGDTVQLCKYFNDQIDDILFELITVGASVDPVFIDQASWANERSDNFPSLFETLLTEPVGVQKLLKELGDSAPHFLYFDERTQLIQFTAIKEPPVNFNVLDDQENILADSFKNSDQPKSRLSDVIVWFGQRDPTKKLDETNNYDQSYIRSDLASSNEDEFGETMIETIYSRWINRFNKAAAVDLASRKGRRFGIIPRSVSFTVAAKDSDTWLGDNIGITHPTLQKDTGEQDSVLFQITSVKEAGDFKYTGLEYNYSDALPDDPDAGIDLVILGANDNNINLRTIYDTLFAAPTSQSVVKFIIDSNANIGSSLLSQFSINTGSWPAGMAPIRLLVKGYAQGKGGAGGFATNGDDGGDCINMSHDLTIEDVIGRIAGGGGGGGGVQAPNENKIAQGGGGAGIDAGTPSATKDTGGGGQTVSFRAEGEPQAINGGDGGGPGESGGDASALAVTVDVNLFVGGSSGAAINTNGFNLVIENGNSNILGAIV